MRSAVEPGLCRGGVSNLPLTTRWRRRSTPRRPPDARASRAGTVGSISSGRALVGVQCDAASSRKESGSNGRDSPKAAVGATPPRLPHPRAQLPARFGGQRHRARAWKPGCSCETHQRAAGARWRYLKCYGATRLPAHRGGRRSERGQVLPRGRPRAARSRRHPATPRTSGTKQAGARRAPSRGCAS